MILEEKMMWREADVRRDGGAKGRRRHVLVRCDACCKEKWMYKNSFLDAGTFHKNNQFAKDFCKRCYEANVRSANLKLKKTNAELKLQLVKSNNELVETVKKTEKSKHSCGYTLKWITDTNHPRLNKNKMHKKPGGGRVYEHVLVMEEHIGRYLTRDECVHHIDGNKSNNEISNLYLCQNSSDHVLIHTKMEQFLYELIKKKFVIFDKDTGTISLNSKNTCTSCGFSGCS